MNNKIKIGITINLDVSPFSNGLQQNIIFLHQLLDSIENVNSYLLSNGDIQKYKFIKESSFISLKEVLNGNNLEFDLIILMGITFNQINIDNLKQKNPKIKFVLMQCGNQVSHDIENSIYRNKLKTLIPPIRRLDAIWTLPQHDLNQQYVRNYFKCEKVIEVPYIWNEFFIQHQLKNENINSEDIIFKKINNIVILEPNLTYQKNCLIPIFIAEEFERKYPKKIHSCNVIGGKTIKQNEYLISIIMNLDIYKKRNDYIQFHSRKPFLNAVTNYGSIIISHQIQNNLNYLYFDALYLNLPLIHNSERISEFGYFYNNHNITEAALLLEKSLEDHKNNLNYYKLNSEKLFLKHSIKNHINIKTYMEIIESIIY